MQCLLSLVSELTLCWSSDHTSVVFCVWSSRVFFVEFSRIQCLLMLFASFCVFRILKKHHPPERLHFLFDLGDWNAYNDSWKHRHASILRDSTRLRNVHKTWWVFVPRYFKLGPHSAKSFLTRGLCHRFEDRQHRSQVRGISGELSFPCLPLDRQRASIEDYLIYFDPFCLTIFPIVPELHRTWHIWRDLIQGRKDFWQVSAGQTQGVKGCRSRIDAKLQQFKGNFHHTWKKILFNYQKADGFVVTQLRKRCLLKLDFCQCFLAVIWNLDCQQSCSTELGISVGCAGVGRLPWRRHVLPRDYEKNQGGMSSLWFFAQVQTIQTVFFVLSGGFGPSNPFLGALRKRGSTFRISQAGTTWQNIRLGRLTEVLFILSGFHECMEPRFDSDPTPGTSSLSSFLWARNFLWRRRQLIFIGWESMLSRWRPIQNGQILADHSNDIFCDHFFFLISWKNMSIWFGQVTLVNCARRWEEKFTGFLRRFVEDHEVDVSSMEFSNWKYSSNLC